MEDVGFAKEKPEDISVSKIVLKTALVFTVIFLLIVLLAFNIAALFFPGFVSNLSSDLGMPKISADFAVGNYEKTKDINDLGLAVERCITADKYDKIIKYANILINIKNSKGESKFIEFCNFKDEQLNEYYIENNINNKSNYFLYIYASFIYSLNKTGQTAKAGEQKLNAENTCLELINNYNNLNDAANVLKWQSNYNAILSLP